MALSLEQINRAAFLARLEVSDAEAQTTSRRLNDILTMIDQMQAVNTDAVEPMSHAQDMAQRLREDLAENEDWREALQAIAPETENGYYLVPKVIE